MTTKRPNTAARGAADRSEQIKDYLSRKRSQALKAFKKWEPAATQGDAQAVETVRVYKALFKAYTDALRFVRTIPARAAKKPGGFKGVQADQEPPNNRQEIGL